MKELHVVKFSIVFYHYSTTYAKHYRPRLSIKVVGLSYRQNSQTGSLVVSGLILTLITVRANLLPSAARSLRCVSP